MEFKRVFEELNSRDVRYVVAGGVATVLHGYARLTADVDIIVELEAGNAKKAIEALVALGLQPRVPVDPLDFADEAKRTEWITSKGMMVFTMQSLSGVPLAVDLFVEVPGDFEALWSDRSEKHIGECVVPVISKRSLIEMKRLSGRSRDLDDIDALELLDE